MQPTFGWRMPFGYRPFMLLGYGVVGVGAILLLTTGTQPAWFALWWTAMVGLNGYWFLLRSVYQLEVRGGVLWWWAPLRSGQVPLTQVVAVRPARVDMIGHVVATRQGTIWVTFATPGFAEFAAALGAVQPTVSVRVGRLAQVSGPRRWLEGAGFYATARSA
jgi:hypothetical protein